MSTLTLALGIIGTLIALGGLLFTWREREDRRHADEQERRDRIEDVELMRRQVASSERQVQLELHATLRIRLLCGAPP